MAVSKKGGLKVLYANFNLEEKMPNLKVGDPAPDFTLKDSNGQTVRLADLRGKKVMLYFFTSPGGGN